MPTRLIREGILTSEKIANLDWGGEVFYRRLMSVVDDYGRCEFGQKLLRAKCYPLQIDGVKDAHITKWIDACASQKLITLYSCNGKSYVQIDNFNQQTRSKSKCPAPDDSGARLVTDDNSCKQLLSGVHLDGGVVGGEDVCVVCTELEQALPSEQTIIDIPLCGGGAHHVTQSDIDSYSDIYGAINILHELKKCKQWNIDNPKKQKTPKGIRRHMTSWLSRAQDKPQPRVNSDGPRGGGVVL